MHSTSPRLASRPALMEGKRTGGGGAGGWRGSGEGGGGGDRRGGEGFRLGTVRLLVGGGGGAATRGRVRLENGNKVSL